MTVPFGPYQPALPDPFAMRLRTRGERIVEVAGKTPIITGYGRRALIEQLRGATLADALVTVERICPQAGQAYRLALSIAAERALGFACARASHLARVAFAELELLLAAQTRLTRISAAFGLRSLAAQGLEQREALYALAQAATGQRLHWGVAVPGGVRPDLRLNAVRDAATRLVRLADAWVRATEPHGALGQAALAVRSASGSHAAKLVDAPGVLGGSESGDRLPPERDPRRDAPYSGYRAITIDWSALDALPDAPTVVAAKVTRLAREMRLSADIVRACVETLGASPDLTAAMRTRAAGEGIATVQSAHGPARVAVTLAPGAAGATSAAGVVVTSLRLSSVAAETLNRAPGRLIGLRLDQTPAMLASLGLCPSCADL